MVAGGVVLLLVLGAGRQRRRVLVADPKQLDDGSHVGRAVHAQAHPVRARVDVLARQAAAGDQLVADACRQREVGDGLAVQVAELVPAEVEDDAAEPVRPFGHRGIGEQLAANGIGQRHARNGDISDALAGLLGPRPTLAWMTFQRGIDGSEPIRARPISARAGAYEDRLGARVLDIAAGTLACSRCDAPVALGGRSVSFAQTLDCPFCRHAAPLRDFLSLAEPTRPARVVVRAVTRDRGAR